MERTIKETKTMLLYVLQRIEYKEALEMALNRASQGDESYFMMNPQMMPVSCENLQELSEQFLAVHEPEYRKLLEAELIAINEEIKEIQTTFNPLEL